MGISMNLYVVWTALLFLYVCDCAKIQPAPHDAEPVVHQHKLIAAALADNAADVETKSQPEPYESPNLYEDPRMGTWYVNQTVVCIILEMGMRFHFNYERHVEEPEEGEPDTEMAHVAVEIPPGVPAYGSCDSEDHHIRIVPFDDWEYKIQFVDLDTHYSATQITIKYVLDATHFPGAVDQNRLVNATLNGFEHEDGNFFKTEKETAFACRTNVQLDGFEEGEDLELERLESANFRVQCFRDDTDLEITQDTTICKDDEVDMIPPIATGIVVGCTMLLVIIVYAIMRMSRNPVYEATTAVEDVESEDEDNDKSESEEKVEDNNVASADTDVEKAAENDVM